jgi:hypothetical protein
MYNTYHHAKRNGVCDLTLNFGEKCIFDTLLEEYMKTEKE